MTLSVLNFLNTARERIEDVLHPGNDGTSPAHGGAQEVLHDVLQRVAADIRDSRSTFTDLARHAPLDLRLAAQLSVKDVARDASDAAKDVADTATDVARGVEHSAGDFAGAFKTDAKEAFDGFKQGWRAFGNAVVNLVDWIGNAAKAIATGARDVGAGVIGGVKQVGEGIFGAGKDVALGLWQATGGFVRNLLEGDIGEAFGSIVSGVDRVLFVSSERFQVGLLDGTQDAVNGFTDALGPVGVPLRWISDRAFDIGFTALDTAFSVVRNAFHFAPDTVVGFITDMEHSVELAQKGNWAGAAKQFGMAFLNVPSRMIGYSVDTAMLFLQAGASMVQTAIGVEQPGRRLTDTERAQLYQVYGDSIDYDIIRVKEGGGINELLAEHTVGNTVYMHADDFNSDGTLNFKGLVTLSHEVGHVWQGQNGGADYIGNALWANFWFQLTTGDRNNAYDWRKALAGGASFETMNAEQQAQVMEDIRIALIDDGRIGANDLNSYSTASYTKAELRFLRSVWRESQQGDGAV